MKLINMLARVVFPTHVGMNHNRSIIHLAFLSIPRACGDEPDGISWFATQFFVFPKHVGMNRILQPSPPTSMIVFPTHVGMNRKSCAKG